MKKQYIAIVTQRTLPSATLTFTQKTHTRKIEKKLNYRFEPEI